MLHHIVCEVDGNTCRTNLHGTTGQLRITTKWTNPEDQVDRRETLEP